MKKGDRANHARCPVCHRQAPLLPGGRFAAHAVGSGHCSGAGMEPTPPKRRELTPEESRKVFGYPSVDHVAKLDYLWQLFPRMVDVLPAAEAGNVAIRHFSVCQKRAEVEWVVRNELWTVGDHVQLDIDGKGWMYDTTHERAMNETAVKNARGRVLIGGLGLGMILWPILSLEAVTKVVVLENNPHVVDLVLPSLASHPHFGKLEVILADALTWEPTDGRGFDTIWLDCVPAYGYGVHILRMQERWMNYYRAFLNLGGWIGHWGYEEAILHLLSEYYGPAKTDERLYPIGPPDPVVKAMYQAYFAEKGRTAQWTWEDVAGLSPADRTGVV